MMRINAIAMPIYKNDSSCYNSYRTCLTNRMWSTSYHITSLVINSLGVDTYTCKHTYTHTLTHTDIHIETILRNHMHTWFKKHSDQIRRNTYNKTCKSYLSVHINYFIQCFYCRIPHITAASKIPLFTEPTFHQLSKQYT